MKIYVTKFFTLVCVGVVLLGPKSVLSSQLKAELKTQGETLNFELIGQSSWDYDLKKTTEKGKVKLLLSVKGLTSQALSTMKNITNPFVDSVKMSDAVVDGKVQVEFILKSEHVEAFDYLTDSPSKLIIDFYFNEGYKPKVVEKLQKSDKKIAESKEKILNKDKKTTTKLNVDKQRAPASNDYFSIVDFKNSPSLESTQVDLKQGLFDSADKSFSRFKLKAHELKNDALFDALTEYYIKYPVLEQELTFWTKMKANFPDYEIEPKNTDENKQARLLKKLFDKKRTFVLQKTTNWFENKYPQSKYLEVAYLLTADLFFKEWQNTGNNENLDTAQAYYQKFLDKYPQSPLHERTSLAVGLIELERKNYLSAIRKLNAHVENKKYNENISKYYAKAAIAEALLKLNKLDESNKELEQVINEAQDFDLVAEAEFKKADYLVKAEKYQEAKNQYDFAIKKYPQFANSYPGAYFNKMESEFRIKKNLEAQQSALDFVQKFARHDFAPYALTRLGEVFEVIGASSEKAVGAYLETHFRYGDSPKTIIARLHLLSIKMKGMKEPELKKTLEKMDELAAKSDLENVQQFKASMIADGYARRKDFQSAIDVLTKFYQNEPRKKYSEQVTQRIKKNIFDYIKFLSENNKHKDVLFTHKKYSDNWIRTEERIDTKFYLAKAYESAGAYKQALNFYEKVEGKIEKLGYDQNSQNIKNKQDLPKIEQIYLAKARVQSELNNYQEALASIEKIKKPDLLTSSEQVERVDIASALYEKKGDYESSIRYLNELVRVWSNEPDLVVNSVARLSKLESKSGQVDQAINRLADFSEKNIAEKNKFIINKTLAAVALENNMTEQAIKGLDYVVNNQSKSDIESGRYSEERFKLGELHFLSGNLKKAKDVWSSFSDKDDTIWGKIAQEKMNSSQWNDDYKKYLKRIPATARGN